MVLLLLLIWSLLLFLLPRLEKGDEVIISAMEHHANLIPWQMVCKAKGANLRIIPISKAGDLDLVAYKKMLSAKNQNGSSCSYFQYIGND